MCRQKFSWEKLLKLYLQILFYTLVIYSIFCITGHEKLSVLNLLWKFWPVKSIASGFTSCFLLFYIFIPFINIFLQSLDKKQHTLLLALLILVFSVLPTMPMIKLSFNYVGWFMVLYLMGAFIRNYGFLEKVTHRLWGWITLGLVIAGSASVVGMVSIYKLGYVPLFAPYFFISDSNKVLSLAIAVSAFMYFKDLKIPHSRLINALGGATFGVLLIHANSNAMRQWLWKETVDCVGNYSSDMAVTLGYAAMSVIVIFIVCAGIDWFRGRLIEPSLINGAKKIITTLKKKSLNLKVALKK